MEQAVEADEETPVLGEQIIISTYETQCATCKEPIVFDTTLPSGWNLKEIKTSIVCPKCTDAKPIQARHGRRARARQGQEARPRGHRRRDVLRMNGSASLTSPQLIEQIEEFLPWDGSEEMNNALADLDKAINPVQEEIPESPTEPTPEPEPSPAQTVEKQESISEHLPTWEPLEEEEAEITNPNYGANQSPMRPIPKSEENSTVRKRRRVVSLVADAAKKMPEGHSPTINCHFCEARQLPDAEICTKCARDVHTGKLPGDNGSPQIDLRSITIKKMKKGDAIDACRTLGLGTAGTVKELKSRLTAHRNSQEK